MEVGIKAARNNLPRLVKAALAGEKVIITDRGKPLVRLVPETHKAIDRKRVYGSLRGVLHLPLGWDSPGADKELLEMFEDLD
jgi:prevent-host-death family protein